MVKGVGQAIWIGCYGVHLMDRLLLTHWTVGGVDVGLVHVTRSILSDVSITGVVNGLQLRHSSIINQYLGFVHVHTFSKFSIEYDSFV